MEQGTFITMTVQADLKTLLETGAHFGHQSRRWDPKMKDYLYETDSDISIFDLVKTKEGLDKALKVLSDAAKNGKSIVLVGTKRQVSKKIKEVAEAAGVYFVNERWLGGTLTNYDQIKKSLEKMVEMKKIKAEGGYQKFTKKERLLIDREVERLKRFFGGIEGLEKLPDLIMVVDVKKESVVVKEANMTGVEVVGIVDSNSDPDGVDYVIPMNDDAVAALGYVLDLVQEAILEGKKAMPTKKKEKK